MATYTVTTGNDETVGASLAADQADGGGLSLREAINWANASDTISFDASLAGLTLTLTQGDLDIGKSLTIDGDTNGDNKADITISGDADGSGTHNAGDSRIFNITAGTVDLNSLTLTDGYDGDYSGGAVALDFGATLNLTDSTVKDSKSGFNGGGIASSGTLNVSNSTISGNEAGFYGGGMFLDGLATFTNTTIHDNTSTNEGGGIDTNAGATLVFNNSTITDNTSGTIGGGIDLYDGSTATLINTVVAGNADGSGANDIAETGTNSTLNTTNSFLGVAASISFGSNSINGGGNALLGALQDNGGPVHTRNAQFGSQLIDAGSSAAVPGGVTTDANGDARVYGSAVDIGATEFIPQMLTVTQNDDTDTVGASLAADLADGGGLSLREAIHWADVGAVITFDASLAGSTLTLTQGDLVIGKTLTIDGDTNGDDKADITISGDADGSGTHNAGDSRIFSITSGTTDLNSLTLTDGYTGSGYGGAIITSAPATLNLTDSTVRDSKSTYHGGGIYSEGTLNVSNSTIANNNSGSRGGGIYAAAGSDLTLANSTVSGNFASVLGGGLAVGTSTSATIANSTITDNEVTSSGGGIFLAGPGSIATFTNSVVAQNTAGSYLDIHQNTPDATTNATNSFFGTTVIIDGTDVGNINTGGDAKLGALQDNGGTVQTHNALLGSQLVNAGSNAAVPGGVTTDANGDARIQGASVDIGATETSLLALTVTQNDDSDTVGASLADDLADGGGLSLREAIHWAEAGAVISFDASLAGSTLTLTQGDLGIAKNLTIDGDTDGDDKADITISGDADGSGTHNAGDSRIFDIITGTTNLNSLTLADGYIDNAFGGGAILASGSTTLNLTDSTVRDSKSAYSGGGIYSFGTLNVSNSTIADNAATRGGGIYFSHNGTLTITNSTISGNSVTGAGDGIGGGVSIGVSSDATIANSTITENSASRFGGGVYGFGSATTTLTNTVVAQNTAVLGGADVKHPDLAAGNNFFGTNVTLNTDNGGNINNAGDAKLGALQDNGGTVHTQNALLGSQLVNAGSNAGVPGGVTTDANGGARIQGASVDIGATETSLLALTVTQNDDTDTVGASLADDLADGGGLSLREAINWAEAGAVITFDASLAGSTLTLTQGELGIAKNLTIDGDTNGDDKADITISGDADGSGTHNAGDSRIFDITSGTTNLDSLTMANGYISGASGGAINVQSGATLNLADSTVRDSKSTDLGGGITSDGTLNVSNSAILDNISVRGGAIYAGGGSDLTLTNSTVSGNFASFLGGGLSLAGSSTATIANSTITDNEAANYGGGIFQVNQSTATLTNTVVAQNTAGFAAGADIQQNTATATLNATNSFFGTTVTIDGTDTGNLNNGGNAKLGALQDNGGTVHTHNALLGSQLVNAGSNAAIPSGVTEDANGGARIQGASVDIGATETSLLALTVTQNDDSDTVGASLADDLADGGGLSLREAIAWADAGAVITFDASLAGSILTLTQDELGIGKNLTIDGDTNGDDKADITISGDADGSGTHNTGDSRIFNITAGTTNLNSLTMTDGYHNGWGGAIVVGFSATLNLTDSTVSDSLATLSGGGIRAQGSFYATNSTISGNESQSFGGGIAVSGVAQFANTTIHGNTADGDGGGVDTLPSAVLTFHNSTVTSNISGADAGGIGLFGASATIFNTVVASNTDSGGASDVAKTSGGATLTTTNSFFGTAATIDTDNGGNSNGGGAAGLGELLDHGGPVLTRSPLDGSALIGAGSNAALPLDVFDVDGNGNTTEVLPLDARGGVRIVGGTVDIGAVEKITDETITGTDADNMIFGGAGADTLNGLGGADTLDGGTGADIMKGGKGDDTYLVDNSGDKVSEAGGNGTDSVTSSVTFKLGGGLETLLLTGTGNIRAIGNNADNTLTGNSGKNILNGGKGADTMNGKGGNDRYVVDNAGDKVSEAGGNGVDTVRSSVTYKLGGGLEKLTLFSNGNTNGTGNGADNTIAGNGGNNKLVGNGGKDKLIGSGGADTLKGGAGNDTLKGGADNDTLQGDAGDDKIFGGSGVDTVVFAAKFSKFTVTKVGNKIKVVDTTGKFGTDDLREVEKLKFGSKVMTVAEALAAKSQKAAPGVSEGDEADAYTAGHDGFDPDAFTFNMGDWWG